MTRRLAGIAIALALSLDGCGGGQEAVSQSPVAPSPAVASPPVTSEGYPDLTGVYDLNGLITGSDPIWGIGDGTRQVAVLHIEHAQNTGQFRGDFTGFRDIEPGGQPDGGSGGVGSIKGSISREGRVVIELFFQRSQSSYWYGEGTLASGQIAGRYGAGGHITGTFTAKRR